MKAFPTNGKVKNGIFNLRYIPIKDYEEKTQLYQCSIRSTYQDPTTGTRHLYDH